MKVTKGGKQGVRSLLYPLVKSNCKQIQKKKKGKGIKAETKKKGWGAGDLQY